MSEKNERINREVLTWLHNHGGAMKDDIVKTLGRFYESSVNNQNPVLDSLEDLRVEGLISENNSFFRLTKEGRDKLTPKPVVGFHL